jgi:hypothetical protein
MALEVIAIAWPWGVGYSALWNVLGDSVYSMNKLSS